MRNMSRPAALLVLLGLGGCPYEFTTNDAGNGAWVEQVVPVLLGRKPINALESQALVDIADQEGRGAVVDVLMSLPEFDAYWTSVLTDAMKVQRTGVLAQTEFCWSSYEMYETAGSANEVLADAFSGQGSVSTPVPGATMNFTSADVVRSAIAKDDLFAPYRVQLFGLSLSGWYWRGPARDVFLSAYTNRTPLCLECHTSNASSSAISPIPVDLDGSVFPDGPSSADNVQFAFAESEPGYEPVFGAMNIPCGSYSPTAEADPAPGGGNQLAGIALTEFDCPDWNAPGDHCESYDTLDLDAALLSGKGSLTAAYLSSLLTDTQAEGGGFSHAPVAGDDGLALALALAITEAVVKDVEGHGLTLPHGHPRVDDQRSYLQGYTYAFLASEWSLETLLKILVHSGTFNMRPPSQSPDLYPFPMFFNGWAADPAEDDAFDNANGQGDLVHRYSIPALFRSVHHALGWPAPKPYPSETAWPNRDLQRALGRYESYEETGFDEVTWQSLLTWEEAVGTCQNRNVDPDEEPDWIDHLVDAIDHDDDDGDLDGDGSVYDYTLEDVLVALKDRLIQEPSIDDGLAEAAPDVVLDDFGAGDDGGVDWDHPDEVAAWAEGQAARADERAEGRSRARAITAKFEADVARLRREAPPLTSDPADADWLAEYDRLTRELDDPTWTRIWNGARSTVDERGAARLLDEHRAATRSRAAPSFSEAGKLSAYFGVALDHEAALVPDLEALLRGYCGTLLTTPQFVLGGVRRAQPEADPVPELLVCMPGEAPYYCDEHNLCELYNGYLVATLHSPLVCP